MEPEEKKETSDISPTAPSQSLEELLAHEPYVYQGKVYSRKRLYRGSSVRVFIVGGYLLFMVVVVGVVLASSYGVAVPLPSFLLGSDTTEAPPTVRVPIRTPPATTTPAAATSSSVILSTSTPVSVNATSTLTTATSTGTTTAPTVIQVDIPTPPVTGTTTATSSTS